MAEHLDHLTHEPVHYLRMLNSSDTWGGNWVTNEGKANAAAHQRLTSDLDLVDPPHYWASRKKTTVTLPGTRTNREGASYTPAEGICVGIWTTSNDPVAVRVWDMDDKEGVIVVARAHGWLPVRILGIREAYWNSDSGIYLALSGENYQAPNA